MTTTAPANLRPALAAHLDQRVAAFTEGFRQNLALIGPEGGGKTFQLERLQRAAAPKVACIYWPLFREGRGSLLRRLHRAVLEAGLGQRVTTQALDDLLERAEPSLPRTAAVLRSAQDLIARRLYAEAFVRSLEGIPVLTQELGRPTLFIVDEFLFLEQLGLTHAYHELGKRVMTWPGTLFVLASSSPYRARLILRERLQLLFGQFELLVVDTVDASTVAPWMHRELRGLRGSRGISPFLVRWLGGSPRYLTVFLKRLNELGTLRGRPRSIDALVQEAAWDLLGNADGPLAQWCCARIDEVARARQGSRAVDCLLQIARGARTTTDLGERIGRGGLTAAMETLLEYDLVQRRGACWVIADPIQRCWITTILAPQRAGLVRDPSALRADFERYLTDLWDDWMRTSQLSFPEQVVRLLGRFADDTVALDAKTGRLPRFDRITTQQADDGSAYLLAESEGRRWCCAVQDAPVTEQAVSRFEAFCRDQQPRPARKVLITCGELDEAVRVLAKAKSMWVWEPEELQVLSELYA